MNTKSSKDWTGRNILIQNGRVIDPANNINEVASVIIKDGMISYVGDEFSGEFTKKTVDKISEKFDIIDGKGLWITPGFIDLHVHLREPGFEDKETIKTGSESAAAGGFTTICPMANTKPIMDKKELVIDLLEKAEEESIVNIVPIASVTLGQKGEEIVDIEELIKIGVCGFSEDGHTVKNPKRLKEAMQTLINSTNHKNHHIPIMTHCEDKDLLNGGVINDGFMAKRYGLKGISNDVEDVITARNIILAEITGAKLHLCHVSTAGSIDLIRYAKERGVKVTAEVTPHHFTLSDEDIPEKIVRRSTDVKKRDLDANYKMAPPLRSSKDVEEILRGLVDGTIDAIATDHAPHEAKTKNYDCDRPFSECANGIVGLETAFSLGMTQLVSEGLLTSTQLIEKLTINPAKILNIDKGTLSVNRVADVTIIDPQAEFNINIKNFKTKGRNSPFHGRRVKGKILYTIVNGEIVYKHK